MNTSKWAIAASCAAFFWTAAAAGPNDVVLTHYEPLEQLDLRIVAANAANGSQKIATAGPLVMSFEAMGRSFDLKLEANSRLMLAARQNPQLDGITIYRGELAGRPGSWARIVVADGVPRGMFWDGQEMFAIEAPGDSVVATNSPIVYRLADAQIAPGSMSCGSMSLATSGAAAFDGLSGELGSISQGPGAVSELELGAIGDFEFTNSMGSDANAAAAITTRLNNVDGIFSRHLGIQISVQVIETFSSSSDPFSDTTVPGNLLDELSTYRSVTPAQNSNGLTHLYTGKDLDGTTVGIAWNGALCSTNFGAGLSEGNGSATFDSLVAAHEIGHNFGAPHDGESGSPCESETGDFLMAPRINNSDQFSSCSIAEMSDDIAAATCISPLPTADMEVTLSSAPTILFGASTVISYDVVNNGTLDARNVSADFTLPPNLSLDSATGASATCTNDAGTANCQFGDVPGLASRTVDLTATPTSFGPGMITAVVSADQDERPSNNQETLQLTVDPAVDLVASSPTGATIRIDQTTTISSTLENRATIDATGVTLTVDLGNALQATSASWSGGSCTVTSQRVTCQSALFAAGTSSTVSVTATGVSAGRPNITVELSSSEPDLVPGDNRVNGRVEVNDPNDESGGSTGPLFLLLMSLTAMLRRRR